MEQYGYDPRNATRELNFAAINLNNGGSTTPHGHTGTAVPASLASPVAATHPRPGHGLGIATNVAATHYTYQLQMSPMPIMQPTMPTSQAAIAGHGYGPGGIHPMPQQIYGTSQSQITDAGHPPTNGEAEPSYVSVALDAFFDQGTATADQELNVMSSAMMTDGSPDRRQDIFEVVLDLGRKNPDAAFQQLRRFKLIHLPDPGTPEHHAMPTEQYEAAVAHNEQMRDLHEELRKVFARAKKIIALKENLDRELKSAAREVNLAKHSHGRVKENAKAVQVSFWKSDAWMTKTPSDFSHIDLSPMEDRYAIQKFLGFREKAHLDALSDNLLQKLLGFLRNQKYADSPAFNAEMLRAKENEEESERQFWEVNVGSDSQIYVRRDGESKDLRVARLCMILGLKRH